MDFRSWCKTYFPGGTFSTSKDGENYGLVKNPYRDDSRPSLSFGTKGKGVYNDFGGRGGDIKFFVHEHGIPEVWDGAEPWEERREGGKILSYRGEDHANARQAWQMWEEGKPADDHPYLQKKGYSGEDLRVTSREYRFEKDVVTPAGTLLIPATDLYGAFQGVERIFPDLSRDKAHRGGKSRCYYGDKPEDGKPLYLVEGWATREAVKRITGGNTAVVEIFGLSCMTGFAKAVKERYPNVELVFCPYAIAFLIAQPHSMLRKIVPTGSRFLEPVKGFFKVHQRPNPVEIHVSSIILGSMVSCRSGLFVPAKSLF